MTNSSLEVLSLVASIVTSENSLSRKKDRNDNGKETITEAENSCIGTLYGLPTMVKTSDSNTTQATPVITNSFSQAAAASASINRLKHIHRTGGNELKHHKYLPSKLNRSKVSPYYYVKSKEESIESLTSEFRLPTVEDHFAKSLGENYDVRLNVNRSKNDLDAVDDHFARALGSNWTTIKTQNSNNEKVPTYSTITDSQKLELWKSK